MKMVDLLERAAADEMRRDNIKHWCRIIMAAAQALACAAILGYVFGVLSL